MARKKHHEFLFSMRRIKFILLEIERNDKEF